MKKFTNLTDVKEINVDKIEKIVETLSIEVDSIDIINNDYKIILNDKFTKMLDDYVNEMIKNEKTKLSEQLKIAIYSKRYDLIDEILD